MSADLGTANKLKSGATSQKQHAVAHSMSEKEEHGDSVSSRHARRNPRALLHGETMALETGDSVSADLAKGSTISDEAFEGGTNAAMADAHTEMGKSIAEARGTNDYVSADLGTANKLKSGATSKKQNAVAHSMSEKEEHGDSFSSRLSSHAGISPHAYACTLVSQRRGVFATTTARAIMNPYLPAVPTITPSPTTSYFSPAYLRAMSVAYPAFITPQQNCFVPSVSNGGGRASVRNSDQGAAFTQFHFHRPIQATYVQNSDAPYARPEMKTEATKRIEKSSMRSQSTSMPSTNRTSADKKLSQRKFPGKKTDTSEGTDRTGAPRNIAASSIMSDTGVTFPYKLYNMLKSVCDSDQEGSTNHEDKPVAWLPEGNGFLILDEQAFVEYIIPLYFGQIKMRSFSRQLNLWGFKR